ncbi:hypothetical protein ACG873_31275 [Mesorhizobium sp. AaZ16]|uniref:hypothetical protein n=1 Tax=Mesorhizobium sp. AaZ16 TaxID=3402289 RepID=UPI00374F1A66
MLLQVNVCHVNTASITQEDPSRENPSCGDQVSTAQTTVLSANVNQRRNTKQRASHNILCLNASSGRTITGRRLNNVKKDLMSTRD